MPRFPGEESYTGPSHVIDWNATGGGEASPFTMYCGAVFPGHLPMPTGAFVRAAEWATATCDACIVARAAKYLARELIL